MLGTFISAFIVVTVLKDRYYDYPQFTGEDGPDRLKNLPSVIFIHLVKWQSQGLNHGVSLQSPDA